MDRFLIQVREWDNIKCKEVTKPYKRYTKAEDVLNDYVMRETIKNRKFMVYDSINKCHVTKNQLKYMCTNVESEETSILKETEKEKTVKVIKKMIRNNEVVKTFEEVSNVNSLMNYLQDNGFKEIEKTHTKK